MVKESERKSHVFIVPNTEDVARGLGAIYRCLEQKDKLLTKLPDGQATSYECFQHGVKKNGAGACLGKRKIVGKGEKGEPVAGPFEWQTYDDVNSRIENFASGMINLDLIPYIAGTAETGAMRLLALFLKNRPEWVIAEQACFRQSATTVPLYDTLGPDTVEDVLVETELTTVLAAPASLVTLIQAKAKCPALKNVIYVDEATPQQLQEASAAGLTAYSFAEVEAKGRAAPVPASPPSPSTVATFCYTSGTTGRCKGAILTHENMVSTTAAAQATGFELGPSDRHLSYLPLAHVFERAVMLLVAYEGAQIGFFQGDTLRLPDDIATLRPTIFASVPRLLNRFHDKILAGVKQQGGLKAKLFNKGYRTKQAGLRNGTNTHKLWDKLVFSKVAKRIGLGDCKYVISGSAPLAPHVMEFLRIVLSCPVVEGYGQTETSAAATAQRMDDLTTGNVGTPLPCGEVRLISVPDMGYLITDRMHGADADQNVQGIPCNGRGEICFRGPHCFKGYYKMPDKTAEAVDAEGWVHSGDIGIWLPGGQLKIVDRKKNIFKLAQGEYVAPEKIENVYTKSPIVSQAFVYGDSLQHQLVAIIVPDAEAAPAFCAEKGIPPAPLEALCRDPKFKGEVQLELERLRKEAKLAGFEHAADIFLDPQPFTPENDLLTPTFKLKRDVAKRHYAKQIDALYAGLGGQPGMRQ